MAKSKLSTLKELKDLYARSKGLKDPSKKESQMRGYDFEKIIEFLLQGLEGKSAYKLKGEQVDGSFFWYGQTFLLEAKWQKRPVSVSEIYAFKGKVDGKFHTTSGIFISYSGFSNDSFDALRTGKGINVLLFDKTDLDYIIEKDIPFIEVLKFKLRMAGDSGLPFVPYEIKESSNAVATTGEIVIVPSKYESRKGADLGDPLTPMFLVATSLQITEMQLLKVFKELHLHQSVSFKFKRITNNQLIAGTISSLSNGLEANESANFIGVLLIVSQDDFNSKYEELLLDTLQNNAIAIDVSIVKIKARDNEVEHLRLSESNIQHIQNFFRDMLEVNNFFYNNSGARNVIRMELNEADWDYDEKTITIVDDVYNMPSVIDNFHDLVQHLTETAYNTASEQTPLEILKDSEYDQDYEEMVYEVLSEYKTRLSKLGWDKEL